MLFRCGIISPFDLLSGIFNINTKNMAQHVEKLQFKSASSNPAPHILAYEDLTKRLKIWCNCDDENETFFFKDYFTQTIIPYYLMNGNSLKFAESLKNEVIVPAFDI